MGHIKVALALTIICACAPARTSEPTPTSAPTIAECQSPLIASVDDAYRRYASARALAQTRTDRNLKVSTEMFMRLSLDHPWFTPALRALGITQGIRGNWVAAYTAYFRYLDLEIHQSDRDRVGAELHALEEKQGALAKFGRGVSWMRAKDFARAATEFSEVIELKPQFSLAYLFLARAFDAMNLHRQAVAAYKEYLEMDPLAPDRERVASEIGRR